MKNLSLADKPQSEIAKHILETENLLSKAASYASGCNQEAEIVLMPDLGIPRGISRISGGFFTGAFYSWQSLVPIVPVDATVNCCSISLFKLNHEIETDGDFRDLIKNAMLRTNQTSFLWNLETSNHFISYGTIEGVKDFQDGYYALIHSSSLEFKDQYNGLYPYKGNWFWDDIKVIHGDSNNRYIRFIQGKTAEKFIRTAKMLEPYNRSRHEYFAGLIFGEQNIENEVLCFHHYGMPTWNSIAIGCIWLFNPTPYLLLTNAENSAFFIDPSENSENQVTVDGNKIILVPHGIGTTSIGDFNLEYLSGELVINGTHYREGEKLAHGKIIEVRDYKDNEALDYPASIKEVLDKCPGKVLGRFRQIYNYNRRNKIQI